MSDFYKLSIKETLKKLDSNSQTGLKNLQANLRQKKYGLNEITHEEKINPIKIFIQQFVNPLVYILLIAVLISFIIGHFIDAYVILAIVMLNSILGFVQEYRAEKALELLKKMAAPHARVLRQGHVKIIDAVNVVPGDILVLEAGDKIPADARIIEIASLRVNEAVLTGESAPRGKKVEVISKDVPLADQENMLFAGTVVSYGRGKAVVTSIGNETEFGKIAKSLGTIKEQETPLQKRLAVFGKRLGIITLVIIFVVFLLGILKNLTFTESLLTSIALAVAAIPEGLPAVVTIALAIGVKRLVKNKALIRKLAAVETLGSTTIICVPKNTPIMCNPSVKEIDTIERGKDLALGFDGNYHKVNEVFERDYEGDIIKIKPMGLPELEITPEHPILISKVKESRPTKWINYKITRPRIIDIDPPEWIEAKNIKKGNMVLVPRIKKENDSYLEFRKGRDKEKVRLLIDDEICELFGWYLAEGCCSKNKGSYNVVFYLGKHEKENIERLKFLIENKLGLKYYIYETETPVRLMFINKDIVNFLSENFEKVSYNKKIPKFMFNSTKENIISFLRAYLKGDGNKSDYYIRFTTASKTLSLQLVILLAKLGIRCRIYRREREEGFISGKKVKNRDSYEIFISGTQSKIIDSCIKDIKPENEKYNFFLNDKDFVYYRVTNVIKENKKLKVYNIETGSQSYCLPFIVHNCADKTGTMTSGEMTVRTIYANNSIIKVSGTGYSTKGNFTVKGNNYDIKKINKILETGYLNNNSDLKEKQGDPTELALKVVAEKARIKTSFKRKDEEPFDSHKKFMATLDVSGKEKYLHVKGAPEVVLDMCKKLYLGDRLRKVRTLTQADRKKILQMNDKMASNALRVLGFAYSETGKKDDLIFLGLMGMIDPSRETVKESIKIARKAGIRVIMITGDNALTAKAIGNNIGLKSEVITGIQLDRMNESAMLNTIRKVDIYARVNPEHKVKILEALQKDKHVVAMTGDGINDAPALKKAHIGIAMGISGTDVSKESSDMILLDDHFSTIVKAVGYGRSIYDNIKKFVKFLLSANLGEISVIFFSLLASLPLPLLPLQILWVNLATDGLPALALGSDPAQKDIMKRKPRSPKETILAGTRTFIIITTIISTIVVLGLFMLEYFTTGDLIKARTIALTTLIFFELFLAFNVRSVNKNIFQIGFLTNKYLIGAVLISVVLHLVLIYTPLSNLFQVTALNLNDWWKIIAASLGGVTLLEARKMFIK